MEHTIVIALIHETIGSSATSLSDSILASESNKNLIFYMDMCNNIYSIIPFYCKIIQTIPALFSLKSLK